MFCVLVSRLILTFKVNWNPSQTQHNMFELVYYSEFKLEALYNSIKNVYYILLSILYDLQTYQMFFQSMLFIIFTCPA